ncbi:uncharacterized protein BP01DRAFT_215775 [Aspergillus saccharolyticus JOP 1030-1]|uniref:Uncharacterized protein n=1 Tax=Aspergillus saccharolyticus JOP 1030-1 TaxID=1450539 RepID=A0A318ZTW3_9EURO|nr:hypothetical protein BP01DRAFT_215775 [Aspergillus saccharolyticus JOP 1030-1]PYH47430.1 hypothetical protein BP01DRAFT_215775 [Aspergillus saccharolyticus JOP 1030-1]
MWEGTIPQAAVRCAGETPCHTEVYPFYTTPELLLLSAFLSFLLQHQCFFNSSASLFLFLLLFFFFFFSSIQLLLLKSSSTYLNPAGVTIPKSSTPRVSASSDQAPSPAALSLFPACCAAVPKPGLFLPLLELPPEFCFS